MTDIKVKPKKESWAGVTGSTLINHRRRIKLGLTVEEYVVLNYIENNYKKEEFPQSAGKKIGIIEPRFYKIAVQLIEKNAIKAHPVHIFTPITNDDQINLDHQFMDLWQINGKNCWPGNKKKAKENYKKVIKNGIATHNELLRRRKTYFEYVEKTGWKSRMHLSTWLNPRYERWNDNYDPDLEKSVKDKKKEEKRNEEESIV